MNIGIGILHLKPNFLTPICDLACLYGTLLICLSLYVHQIPTCNSIINSCTCMYCRYEVKVWMPINFDFVYKIILTSFFKVKTTFQFFVKSVQKPCYLYKLRNWSWLSLGIIRIRQLFFPLRPDTKCIENLQKFNGFQFLNKKYIA